MPVVTLTSDWNQFDYYVAALKGRIVSNNPTCRLIDLNHSISVFRLAQAAFVLRNSYFHFPKETIHLICLNSEPLKDKKHLVVEYDGHFFVSADNGILGLVCNEEDKIGNVFEYTGEAEFPSFSILSIYPEIINELISGKRKNHLERRQGFDKHVPMRPVFDEKIINGSIIYIDTYQNAITNITKRLFEDVGKGRPFEIFVQSNHNRIVRLNTSYNETSAGELLALFNSLSLLEVAIKEGNAAELLNLGINSVVRIKFA